MGCDSQSGPTGRLPVAANGTLQTDSTKRVFSKPPFRFNRGRETRSVGAQSLQSSSKKKKRIEISLELGFRLGLLRMLLELGTYFDPAQGETGEVQEKQHSWHNHKYNKENASIEMRSLT